MVTEMEGDSRTDGIPSMEPLCDFKAPTDMQQHANEWKMDWSFSVDNRSRYDPEEHNWRSHSASVNNDRESRIDGDEFAKDCKSSTFCLNASSPSQDVPPEFEKVFVKVEDASASDEEPDEQKFWNEQTSVGQEPQAGCSSWSDEVDHQRGRDSKGGSHQHKDHAEDHSGACDSPVTNDPEAAVYCVGSKKDCRSVIPCLNSITSNNALPIDEVYACGFEEREYLSIPIEVLDKETKTSALEQVDQEMIVSSCSEEIVTQNFSNNRRLTIENYVCEICDFETATLKIFKDHMLTEHSDKKPFRCKFCDYKCSTCYLLKIHERSHTGEKPYNCKFCDFKCSRSSDLSLHERNHTGEKPFHCKFCDFKCARSASLKNHERIHTGEKPYNCKFCDYKCSKHSSLKSHEKTHTGEKPFNCKFCDYKCSRSSDLIVHERLHTGEYPYHCEFCDFKCSRSFDLKCHKTLHTGEYPYHCEFCDFKCSRSSALKRHERIHTGDKPYNCKFCDFKCTQITGLKIHERTHTGEKPFNCKFCDFKCSHPTTLKNHETKHTGEKPYHCQLCDYKCAQLGQFKRHERTHSLQRT